MVSVYTMAQSSSPPQPRDILIPKSSKGNTL